MKYIVGTGWWCSGNEALECRRARGDPVIRTQAFSRLWQSAVLAYTDPEAIVVVDSASPVAPVIPRSGCRFVHIRLPFNAGHSVDHLGLFCGWTRSVLMSLQYAIASDAEYFVYIEQDALIHGEGIVEHCIGKMMHPYMFGHPGRTIHALQQSFFIIHRAGMNRFMGNLLRLNARDGVLNPENKFAVSCSDWLSHMPPGLWALRRNRLARLTARLGIFDFLPVGYGRTRPIDFNQPFYYFQHARTDELEEYLARHPDFSLPDQLD